MRPQTDVFDRAAGFAKENGIEFASPVLLGLSGGADSVFLLLLLLHFGVRPLCVHVNHMIRGDEADRDEEFCRKLCREKNAAFVSVRENVPDIAKRTGKGLEEAARGARWGVFYRIARENGIGTIAVAHNADDRAETFLFNIARGSGTKGMASVLPIRRKDGFTVIRPILCFEKREITGYLDLIGQKYVTDSTNADISYTRNYIRSELLPRFERLNDAYLSNINKSADLSYEADAFIEECAEKYTRSHPLPDAESFSELHPCVASRVLNNAYYSLTCEALSKRHIDLIRGFMGDSENGRRLQLPYGVDLIRENGVFRFIKRNGGEKYSYPLLRGKNAFPGYGLDIYLETAENASSINELINIYKLVKRFKLSSDIINDDLYVRSREDSDRVIYGNMTHEVKKLLSEKKVPSSLRKYYPVICDKNGILSVPPFVCRDGVRGDEGIFITCCVYRGKYENERNDTIEHT